MSSPHDCIPAACLTPTCKDLLTTKPLQGPAPMPKQGPWSNVSARLLTKYPCNLHITRTLASFPTKPLQRSFRARDKSLKIPCHAFRFYRTCCTLLLHTHLIGEESYNNIALSPCTNLVIIPFLQLTRSALY